MWKRPIELAFPVNYADVIRHRLSANAHHCFHQIAQKSAIYAGFLCAAGPFVSFANDLPAGRDFSTLASTEVGQVRQTVAGHTNNGLKIGLWILAVVFGFSDSEY